MKPLQTVTMAVIFGLALTSAPLAWAAEPQPQASPGSAAKPVAKPYPLKTCLVTGEKLGGDMGDPLAFTYEGQEIKLCCKGCKKAFDKEPAKYIKKLAEEVRKLKTNEPAPEHKHS